MTITAAVFVVCITSLLNCIDLPFVKEHHTFEDPDKCRIAVAEIIKNEQSYRIKNKYPYTVVMGKCVQWCEHC